MKSRIASPSKNKQQNQMKQKLTCIEEVEEQADSMQEMDGKITIRPVMNRIELGGWKYHKKPNRKKADLPIPEDELIDFKDMGKFQPYPRMSLNKKPGIGVDNQKLNFWRYEKALNHRNKSGFTAFHSQKELEIVDHPSRVKLGHKISADDSLPSSEEEKIEYEPFQNPVSTIKKYNIPLQNFAQNTKSLNSSSREPSEPESNSISANIPSVDGDSSLSEELDLPPGFEEQALSKRVAKTATRRPLQFIIEKKLEESIDGSYRRKYGSSLRRKNNLEYCSQLESDSDIDIEIAEEI